MQMQVAQIATGIVKSLFSRGGGETSRDEVASAKSTRPGQAGQSLSRSAFRQIMAENDLHNLSPREFSDLVQQLHDAGELEPADLQDLLGVRVQLDGHAGGADARLDVVKFVQQRLHAAEQAASTGNPAAASGLESLRRQTAWIERLDRAHQSTTEAPVDVTV